MPKARDIPDCPPIPVNRGSGMVTRDYRIQLVTPMFGGGVKAGITDREFPIRETAIRGHLRHWWRVTIGSALKERMWLREEEIFGSTEFPSPLTVRVTGAAKLGMADLFDPNDRNVVPPFGPTAYALFSAIENDKHVAQEGITFNLHLSVMDDALLSIQRKSQNARRKRDKKSSLPKIVPAILPDIEIAFHAWIAFGGLGARTRRGCGAVHCQDMPARSPNLAATILIGAPLQSPISAWKEAVGSYRDFRQSPRGAKHDKTISTKDGLKSIRVPGRSHWPEADSIRQITGCALKPSSAKNTGNVPIDEDTHDHSQPVVPKNLLPAFPKAVLGLPINFHFADGPGKFQQGQRNLDPKDVQLLPLIPTASGKLEKADRMASPVITRPLWLNGNWHPAVIIFDQPLPDGFQVRLEGENVLANGNDVLRDLPLNHVEDASLANLRPMRQKPNALHALREFLIKELGFKEVSR